MDLNLSSLKMCILINFNWRIDGLSLVIAIIIASNKVIIPHDVD